jgi:osmoprotectant transport system permease protein
MIADFLAHLQAHVLLSAAALSIGAVCGIALGAAIAEVPAARGVSLSAINALRVVPSLAVLALVLPYVGLGFVPAVLALVLLAIPPIAINAEVALRTIPAPLLDAAAGMGMTAAQTRLQVRWPLAAPVIFSGLRTATTEVIASATLAAFIGAGGFGEYIVNGLASNNMGQLLEGALGVAALALAADAALGACEKRLGRWMHR